MSWNTVGVIFFITLFSFWLYCMFRLFIANRNGEKKRNYVVVDPGIAESPDDLVIVAQFADQLTADLYRVHLESEGIEGVVLGNSYSKGQPRYVLQVRAEDAGRAAEVLNKEQS